MKLSVVIPVYNEEENIVDLIEEVVSVMPALGEYEIVVVDDGSKDKTLDVLKTRQAKNDIPLRIIRHLDNCGQSTALHTGVTCSQGEWIITLDGDGQNNPVDIPALYSRLNGSATNLKLVCGHRQKRQDSQIKLLSSRVANGIRSRILGDGVADTGCGLKMFPRDVFLNLPFFDHMHRFLPALVRREGWDVVSCPVSHRPRTKGKSKYGIHNRLWAGIIDMLGVLWLKFRCKQARYEEI